MKKQLLFLAGMLFCLASFGQVRVGIGFIGALPQGNFDDIADFGAGLYLEPKVSFGDIEAALNLGAMGFAGGDLSGSGGSVSATAVINTTIVGYYFLSTPGVKPYFALGAGPYFVNYGSVDSGSGSVDIGKDTKFGFMPKIGINAGSFDLGLSYHIVKDLNFLALNLGFNIGKRA